MRRSETPLEHEPNYRVQFFPFDQQFEFINQVLENGFRYKPTDWAK